MCPCRVRLVKPSKHTVNVDLLRFFHIIGASEHRFAVLTEQCQRYLRISVHQSVFNQVLESTAHSFLISLYRQASLAEVHFRLNSPALKFFIERKYRIINTFSKINALHCNFIIGILQSCVGKQFLQHFLKAGNARLNDLNILPPLLLRIALLQELEISVQRGERRADIMGQIRYGFLELRLVLTCSLPDLTGEIKYVINPVDQLIDFFQRQIRSKAQIRPVIFQETHLPADLFHLPSVKY